MPGKPCTGRCMPAVRGPALARGPRAAEPDLALRRAASPQAGRVRRRSAWSARCSPWLLRCWPARWSTRSSAVARLAVVVMLARVIAAVAVAETVVSLVTRWLSSTIGEGLILDLRTAVFDHVQRMPVAFFTRTRTGALVSRLGNDVHRRAARVLRHAVRRRVQLRDTDADAGGDARPSRGRSRCCRWCWCRCSWCPRAGSARTMARLSREAAINNATMNTQMTERFSAPGATLVKLFGSPATRVARVRRAGRSGARHRGAAPRCCSRRS